MRSSTSKSSDEHRRCLEADDLIVYSQISRYETGNREPPLNILLRYARTAGVYVEDLIDDELDLPKNLPGPARHTGLKRTSRTRKR